MDVQHKTRDVKSPFLIVLLGLSHLVVTSDIFFFSLLTRKTATERPFEVWGFPRFWEGGGTVKENCLARPIKKICPKCMPLKVHPIKKRASKIFVEKIMVQNVLMNC